MHNSSYTDFDLLGNQIYTKIIIVSIMNIDFFDG